MVIVVPYEYPHCKGNESQDIVVVLENVLMSTEKGDTTPRSKGLHEIHEIRSGTDREHERSQEAVRLKISLGWGYVGRMSGNNHKTISNVRGTTIHGVKLC